MLIRSRIGVSLDGFVATGDGRPALLALPEFASGESHGYTEFASQIKAVVMGRTTFEPAVGASHWPWPGLQVYVLTSQPLSPGTPDDVIASSGGPAGLVEQLRAAELDGDVHLVGGPSTLQAFHALGALDRLEVLVLPILLGEGVPFSPPGSPEVRLELLSERRFADGTVELVYTPR